MAGYIYNPGESIRRDFQQTQAGLGEIFTQIIQQQQKDYALAESTFANIEALKKDVNIYGQKSITDKANNLLSYTSNSILKDGKLDYSKIGEVRRAVSDIKDLKIGYDLAAKEYEKALQLGVGSKEDLLSFQKYYSDLGALMNNENLIKNPRDLQVAFSKTYTNNLNGSKKFVDVFKTVSPFAVIEKQITNSKGGISDVKGEIPKDWNIDDTGKLSMPQFVTVANPDGTTKQIPYVSQVTAQINATDKTLIPLLREQNGSAVANMSDEQIVDFYLKNKINPGISSKETKSKSDIDAAAANATIAAANAKVVDKINALNIAGKELANKGQKLENQTKQMTIDALKSESQQAGSENEIFFSNPKSLVMPIGKASSDVIGKSQKISYDSKSGQIFVSALKSKNNGFNVGENTTDITGVQAVPIPRNKLAAFKKSVLTSALTGIEKDQKPIVKRNIENIFKKAQFGSVSDTYLNKLTLPNKLAKNEKYVTLSDLRELYSQGKYSSIDEAIQDATNRGLKVTRQ